MRGHLCIDKDDAYRMGDLKINRRENELNHNPSNMDVQPPSTYKHRHENSSGDDCENNINDIMDKMKMEVKHECNWMEPNNEEFEREYMNLPLPPPKKDLHLRLRRATMGPRFAKMPLLS